MPFDATLARYVADVAADISSELNTLRVKLISLHQIAEEAFIKLYEGSQVSVEDCDKLEIRYQILRGASNSVAYGRYQKYKTPRSYL